MADEKKISAEQLAEMIKSECRNAFDEAKGDMISESIERGKREWEKMGEADKQRSFREAMRAEQTQAQRMSFAAKLATPMALTAIALAKAKSLGNLGNGPAMALQQAQRMADTPGMERVIKALQASDLTGGGSLIPKELSSDFIDILRANMIMDRLGVRTVTMDTDTVGFGRLNSSATGYWVDEGGAITVSQPGFGKVKLNLRKMGVLVPISNDLLSQRTIPEGADEIVAMDMIFAASNTIQQAFFDGSGGSSQPLGVYGQAAAGNKFNATAFTGTGDVAKATLDLLKLEYKVLGADVPASNPGYAGNPRTRYKLMSLRTSDGYPVFMESLSRGELMGHPALFTNDIPITYDDTGAASNDETRLYFGAWDQVIAGQARDMEMTQSADAMYIDGSGNHISTFQVDETLLRLITKRDQALRHNKAVAVLTGIDWGTSFSS